MLALKTSLEQLQEKLQLLIKQYGVLDKENQQLKASLTKQENKNSELLEQLNASKHQLTASMMHTSEMNPADKEKWVKQIDQYIKEIDTAIKNLNP
jgi:predicted nuclease with TOPRIM domain